MPALYKFPPHPLCPGIQFKQLNPYLEDEPPLCSEPPLRDSLSAGAESALVFPLPVRDPHSCHGAPAAGAHHEAAARANGNSSASFEKPHKESRRQRERELSGLELKIPYSMARVPECTITSSGIHGSILCPAFKREIWEAATGELLHLCHEAAERRSYKTGTFHGIFHEHAEAERLNLEFIQDRMATDDPIRGYLIRTNDNDRYLQGFVWYTTFTSWTHFFRWDSLAPEGGLTGTADKHPVRWDHDGLLAGELELQYRSGDPRDQGVIWPKVAEISLMGALGCGEFLTQLVLEEMEAANAFDYAVVQATESSAGFYDRMGFIRVGAIAKYIKPGEERQAAVIPPVAYRHFVGPDQDVKDVDHSIMMAIRLRAGRVPRRVMTSKGGIFANLGRDVPVGLSAPALDSETVQKLLSSDISGGDIEAKVVGDTLVLGPGASDFSLRLLAEHMGGEQWARAKAVLCEAPDQKDDIARPGRASSEIARRKMNLWLSPTAHRPWTCYGTIPETPSGSARGSARRGRGNRVIRASIAGRSPRFKGMASPGTGPGDETQRRRPGRPAGLDLSECVDGKKPARTGRCPGSASSYSDGLDSMGTLHRESPTGGISRLRKETVRDICLQLNIPISRKLPFLKLQSQKSKQQLIASLLRFDKESPIAWVQSDALSMETLQNVCMDLHLESEGSAADLRSLLANTLTENFGEFLSPSGPSGSGDASHGDKRSQKKRTSGEGPDSKKTEKRDGSALAAENGQEESCVWDYVVCEACGSGEGEERIILCDGCDQAFHLECTSPPLKEVPEGEWYCMPCEVNRREQAALDEEAAERERKLQAMREERNRKERERRAREKKLREEAEEQQRREREEQEKIEREKQLEREERQRKAHEQREKRIEEERIAKEKERERKVQKERDRKAKEQREKEERDGEEREERERKQRDKEDAKGRKESKDGKKDKDVEVKAHKTSASSPVVTPRGKVSQGSLPVDVSTEFADWDVASDEDGKVAWNQKLKHTWYGGPGMEWLTKETLRSLCQEMDMSINRKLPCTKITVAKSKQQLIGTLERWSEEEPFAWVEHENVTEETLRAACMDLCVNTEGDEEALRARVRAVFDNPDVYVQRMFSAQGDDATSGLNAWDQIECEKCHSTEDEERMVLCDMCDAGYHLYCCEPKLKAIPEGEWICKDCRKSKQKRKRVKTEDESGEASGAAAQRDDGKKKRSSADGKTPRSSNAGIDGPDSGRSKASHGPGTDNPWDLVECQKCGSQHDEERMVLCDVCDAGYHFYCAEPKLKKLPEGDWMCHECRSKTGKKKRRRRTQAEILLARANSGAGGVSSSQKTEDAGEDKGGATQDKVDSVETPWDEIKCGKCGSTEDEDRMVLCDNCDAGYHLYCCEPKLSKIPEGDWICLDCRKSQKKQKRVALSVSSVCPVVQERKSSEPKASDPFADMECHVCGSAKNEERMILCDVCDAGYHLDCVVPKLKKVPDGDWICPDCARQKKGTRKTEQERRGARAGKMRLEHAGDAASNSEGQTAGAQNLWDLVECQHCGSAEGEDRMILCDMCDGGYHLECTGLEAVPDGEWICKPCSRARQRAQSKREQEKKYKEFQERISGVASVGQSKVSGRQIVAKQPYKVPH